MSDTPRTDAVSEYGDWPYDMATDLCDQLERELAAANIKLSEVNEKLALLNRHTNHLGVDHDGCIEALPGQLEFALGLLKEWEERGE